MPSTDLIYQPAHKLGALMRRRELSPVEVVDVYLARIEEIDAKVRAYITVCGDEARAQAREAEAAISRGEYIGPLHGIPVAVKDQFDTAGIRTTMASRIFSENVPDGESTVTARLQAAGTILLGKLNMTEFAFGDTRDFVFGTPRNPWNLDRIPGSSSAGSGIAVSAGMAAVAIGEDTGGSVRLPAAMCGIVGLRPTTGRTSRYRSFPMCWSMDTAGPMTRTVRDCADLLAIIAGHDPNDPLSSPRPVDDYSSGLDGGVRGMKIGYLHQLINLEGVDEDTRNAVNATRDVFQSLGAETVDVNIPLLELAGPIYIAIGDSDAADTHESLLRQRHRDYDVATRTRLMASSLIPASLYHRAQRARQLLRKRLINALEDFDVLVGPVVSTPAPEIKEVKRVFVSEADVRERIFGARSLTTPFNLAGLPAISIPCGFSEDGLPIGLQIAGRAFDEATVLRVSAAYERATDWHQRVPPI